jgi:hypothetical protein
MYDRPLPITIIAIFLIIASGLIAGAVWSGSPGGHAFAEAATASYDSSWLPGAGAAVGIWCGVGMFLGWRFSRFVFLCWMGWGILEGLVLLSPTRFNLATIGVYAVIVGVLFLPPSSNEWFRKDAA